MISAFDGYEDPSIGQAAGFGGVILHGLSTYGFAARAVLSAVGGNDASALKYFGVRFTSPVKPGDALETSIWEVGSGPDGTTEVVFVTKNLKTGKVRRLDWLVDAWFETTDITRKDRDRQWRCVCEENREEQVMKSSSSPLSLYLEKYRIRILLHRSCSTTFYERTIQGVKRPVGQYGVGH